MSRRRGIPGQLDLFTAAAPSPEVLAIGTQLFDAHRETFAKLAAAPAAAVQISEADLERARAHARHPSASWLERRR